MKNLWNDLGGKLGVGLCGAGLLLVFLGWNGAASVDRVEAQFPYLISGGVGGLSLIVIGVGLLVLQNQRADRARLEQRLRELRDALGPAEEPSEFRHPEPRPTPERYRVEPPAARADAPEPEAFAPPSEPSDRDEPTARPPARGTPRVAKRSTTAKKRAAKKTAAKKPGTKPRAAEER